MPCPLLERFVSFFPAYSAHVPFEMSDTADARTKLIFDVKTEARDKNKTHRRVWEASNVFLCMLFTGSIKQVASEALSDKPLPYMMAQGDLLDLEYLNTWIAFGDSRIHTLVSEHVEFRLQTEAYQRGSDQIVDDRRQLRRNETEACVAAIRAVQEYVVAPRCDLAKPVGQHFYNLCMRGSVEFTLQQGRRLLEVRMHDDNSGRQSSTGHRHAPGVGEGR